MSHPRMRRRLVLYSGGQERRNALIHESLLELALRGRRARRRDGAVKMTYVPYTALGARPFYRRFERRYRAFGAKEFACVPADAPELTGSARERAPMLRALHDSDVIYLAGGNTFEFLHHLRSSDLLTELSRFHERGGVLAGLSAGAILLTPDIALAGYPSFDHDANDVGLGSRELSALGLVDFDFSRISATRRATATRSPVGLGALAAPCTPVEMAAESSSRGIASLRTARSGSSTVGITAVSAIDRRKAERSTMRHSRRIRLSQRTLIHFQTIRPGSLFFLWIFRHYLWDLWDRSGSES